jgi:hypothetical protein
MRFFAFSNLRQNVREQVKKIKEHPLIPKDIRVSGFIYDVGTGRLRNVVYKPQVGVSASLALNFLKEIGISNEILLTRPRKVGLLSFAYTSRSSFQSALTFESTFSSFRASSRDNLPRAVQNSIRLPEMTGETRISYMGYSSILHKSCPLRTSLDSMAS